MLNDESHSKFKSYPTWVCHHPDDATTLAVAQGDQINRIKYCFYVKGSSNMLNRNPRVERSVARKDK